MARPRKEIDWADVEKLCALQCTQEEVAQFCQVTVDTLNSRCKDEQGMSFSEFFDLKRGTGKVSLRRAQWQLAHKGNATMLIWLGKQYLGQRDRALHEHSGPDGTPISMTRADSMSDDEISQRIQKLLGKAPDEPGTTA